MSKKLTDRVERAIAQVNVEPIHPDHRQKVIDEVLASYNKGGVMPPLEEITQAVDEVIGPSDAPITKKKIPVHYWVLGGIVAIPLAVPLIRLTEAGVMLLLRIFI